MKGKSCHRYDRDSFFFIDFLPRLSLAERFPEGRVVGVEVETFPAPF